MEGRRKQETGWTSRRRNEEKRKAEGVSSIYSRYIKKRATEQKRRTQRGRGKASSRQIVFSTVKGLSTAARSLPATSTPADSPDRPSAPSPSLFLLVASPPPREPPPFIQGTGLLGGRTEGRKRKSLPHLSVDRLENRAVGAVAELLRDLVPVHGYKGGGEGGGGRGRILKEEERRVVLILILVEEAERFSRKKKGGGRTGGG